MSLDIEFAGRIASLEAKLEAQSEEIKKIQKDGEDRARLQDQRARDVAEKLQALTDAALKQQGFIKGFRFAVGAFWAVTGGVVVSGMTYLVGGIPR